MGIALLMFVFGIMAVLFWIVFRGGDGFPLASGRAGGAESLWEEWAEERDLEVERGDDPPRFRIVGLRRGVPVEVAFIYTRDGELLYTELAVQMPALVPKGLTVESEGSHELLRTDDCVDIRYSPVDRHFRFIGRDERAVVDFFDDSGIRHLMQRLADMPGAIRWDERELRGEVRGLLVPASRPKGEPLGPASGGGEQLEVMVELAREVQVAHGTRQKGEGEGQEENEAATILDFPDEDSVEEADAEGGEGLEWETPE